MSKNPNISIGFSQNRFAQETNKMASALKEVKKEFEITNLAIEATGDKMGLCENRLKGFAEEAKIVKAATATMEKGLQDAMNTQSKLTLRTEAAKQAYESVAKSESKSTEVVEKLKKEYDDLVSRLTKADKAVSNWKNKLMDSQIAENKLKVAVSQTVKEIEKQNQEQTKNIKNTRNVTTATGQLLNVYTLLKGLAVGYAGKTLFESLVGGNAKFEQYMANFEVLLDGADKAQKRMNELTVFAAKTPFELPQVVEAEKRLLAYGVAAKDTAEVMQILGDISMGNAEKLNMISLAYGQVVTNAKLYGTELRQFAENGVPLLAELAKMYGKTEAEMRKMVEGGQISSQAVTEALRRMTTEGGKFYGMMDKQSQTMQGLWATLRDNVSMFARDVGEDSFEYLKDELNSFMDNLDQMSQSGELGDMAAEWGSNIAQFTEYSLDAVKILWDMKGALISVGAAMAITSIINGAAQAWNALRATVMMAKVGFDAAKVSNDVLTASLIKSPWGAVAVAIGLVVGALITYSLTSGSAQSETDKLISKTKELTEEYERNIQAVDRQTSKSFGEVSISQRLAKELDNLSSKTNKTTSEKTRMSQIVDQLNTNIPNLALAINTETGELNKQIGVVYNAIDAYRQLLFVKASEKKAGVAAESLLDLDAQKAQLEAKLKPLQQIVDKYNKYKSQAVTNTNGSAITVAGSADEASTNKKYFEIVDEYNSLSTQLQSVADQIDSANKQIDDSFKAAEDYAKKYGKSGDPKGEPKGEPPPLITDPENGKKAADKAREEAIQKEFNDLKFAKEMEYITEAEYYKQLAALRDKYYKAASAEWQQYTLEIKQYNDKLKEEQKKAELDKYEARRQNSDRWIAEQKHYSQLTSSEEIKAYEAIRKYVTEYYKSDVIDYKEYLSQIREINKNEYDIRKRVIEETISSEVEKQKKALEIRKQAIEDESEQEKSRFNARKKAIEDEYALIDQKEKQDDRNAQLVDLSYQENMFRNAATKEGKERLKKIQDEIANLNKEAAKEQRNIEKNNKLDALEQEQIQAEEDRKKRLDAISREYENLDQRQQSLLKNIADYAELSAGALETVTAKVRALIDAFNQAGGLSTTSTQTVNQNNVTINQTNNNKIADPVSASIFGAILTSGFNNIA